SSLWIDLASPMSVWVLESYDSSTIIQASDVCSAVVYGGHVKGICTSRCGQHIHGCDASSRRRSGPDGRRRSDGKDDVERMAAQKCSAGCTFHGTVPAVLFHRSQSDGGGCRNSGRNRHRNCVLRHD